MERFEQSGIYVAMRRAVSGMRVIPPSRGGRASGDDDGDMVLDRLPLPGPVASWAIHVRYVNAAGEESERTITCKRLTAHLGGALTVSGYCHLRGQPRTFALRNMIEVVDAETGEFVEPSQYFAQLRTDGLPFTNKGMETFSRLCTFMSQCDGHEHPSEWAEIEHGLERYALRFGGDDSDIEAAVKACRSLAPDDRDFVRSVSAVSRSPDGPQLARIAIDTCAKIVDADGRHAEEELTWGLHIGEVLKDIAVRPR